MHSFFTHDSISSTQVQSRQLNCQRDSSPVKLSSPGKQALPLTHSSLSRKPGSSANTGSNVRKKLDAEQQLVRFVPV